MALGLLALLARGAGAQERAELTAGVGAGATYYCIVSRCDQGAIGRISLGYRPASVLAFEGAAAWHDCFDCDRFLVGEAGIQLRRPGPKLEPFVSAGAGLSSDPEFMGDRWGLYAAAGAWAWLPSRWGAQLELRGRRLGRGNDMGELSLTLGRRIGGPTR
jgi:hypothetical protein